MLNTWGLLIKPVIYCVFLSLQNRGLKYENNVEWYLNQTNDDHIREYYLHANIKKIYLIWKEWMD